MARALDVIYIWQIKYPHIIFWFESESRGKKGYVGDVQFVGIDHDSELPGYSVPLWY